MSGTAQPETGSAAVQAALWGVQARDWAEIEDEGSRPIFEAVFDAVGVGEGTRLLDVGCGTGLACEVAAARGAKVSGLDAAPGQLEIARERVPGGDFRVGDMQALPYGDHAFDVVTLFSCLFFADDQEAALREAGRVAGPAAPIGVVIWGPQERVQASAFLAAVGPLLPPGTPELQNLFYEPGVIEDLARRAGLKPERSFDIDCPWVYPDRQTLIRGWLSAGPATLAIQSMGEQATRDAIAAAVEPFRTANGGYRLQNVFRCMVATT
jgi:SAM-dependent methyltransferase